MTTDDLEDRIAHLERVSDATSARLAEIGMKIDRIYEAMFVGSESDRGGALVRVAALERSVDRLWRLWWTLSGAVGAGALAALGYALKRALEATP